MKHIIAFLLISSLVLSTFAQSPASFDYNLSSAAIIVKHADNSAQWYQAVFGLKVKNTMEDAQAGYKVVILESPELMLELLELKGSLATKNLLEGKPDGTKIQGHFKIGFNVPDMDACLKQLESLKINIPQIWTDPKSGKRNFLIQDPDGNLIQFFE